MITNVIYENVTRNGEIKISMNCYNEIEYNLSIENRKWLYPKIEKMLFATELLIRGDPSMVHQINKVLNRTFDDMLKLIEITKE